MAINDNDAQPNQDIQSALNEDRVFPPPSAADVGLGKWHVALGLWPLRSSSIHKELSILSRVNLPLVSILFIV